MNDEQSVYIIDSTLRDGEQAPGVVFSHSDKLRLAEMLSQSGVDELEAGIPAMGSEECRAIRDITGLNLSCTIGSWCRARRDDLENAARLGTQGVHISFPVSTALLTTIGKDATWVFRMLEDLVPRACKEFPRVSVGALDATRANETFLCAFATLAFSCGAVRLRIADTVGVASPVQVMRQVRRLREQAPGLQIEFHGHNDLGMATANAVCAVLAGADALSVTVNGLGERAGNVPLEEIALALPVAVGKACHLRPDKLLELCSLVSRISGREIPPNKPVTGELIFTHESGIHSHGLMQDDLSYQPYLPQRVGRQTRMVLGKHSGRHAVEAYLENKGV